MVEETKARTKSGRLKLACGAKRKLNLTNAQIVEAYIKCGYNKTELVKLLGITRSNLYTTYLKEGSGLWKAFEDAESAILDLAESKLLELIESGYFPAIKFLLVTKGRSRGYTEHLNITTDILPHSARIIQALNRKHKQSPNPNLRRLPKPEDVIIDG